MLRRVLIGVACVLAILTGRMPAASAGSLALDFTGGSNVFCFIPTGTGQCSLGWGFVVNSTITVDGLGIWDEQGDGLVNSHQVGLFNDVGMALLASATITNSSTRVTSSAAGGSWLFESISPLTLNAGSYSIAALYPAFNTVGGDFIRVNAVASTIPEITFVTAKGSGCCFYPETPSPEFNHGLFGPTFSVVPEPAMLALIGIGLAGLGLGRRKRAAD